MPRSTYTLAEVAERYGCSLDWLYRHRPALHAHGLPAPISPIGRPKFPRAQVDAWLAGHGKRPAPANDVTPPIAAVTVQEERELLARVYGGSHG